MAKSVKLTALAGGLAVLTMVLGAGGTAVAQSALSIDKDGVKIGTLETDRLDVGGNLAVVGDVAAASVGGKGTVPKGAILMWSGAPEAIPAGWTLCDGTNGTPNLSGRFIVGYDEGNTDYNKPGNTGGSNRVTLTVEQMPKHSHSGSVNIFLPRGAGFGDQSDALANNLNNWGGWAKDFPFKTAETGGSQPFDNRPPYHVLAYIMYVGSINEARDYLFRPGQDITSPNKKYRLVMELNGNLVFSETSGTKTTLWQSQTGGMAGYWIMQRDGNLVAYPSKGPPAVWASNTSGNTDAYLRLEDDGKAVIYAKDNRRIWGSSVSR